jgi:hypothetical protein
MRSKFTIIISFFILTACSANQVIPTSTMTATFIQPTEIRASATAERPMPTSTLVPTEVPRFTAENVGHVPTSREEMKSCPMISDPLKNSLGFQTDAFSLMSLADKELFPNYKGKYIEAGPDTSRGAHQVLSIFNTVNEFELFQDIQPIGCFRYPVAGSEDGLGLLLPAQDSTHKFLFILMVDPTLQNTAAGARRTMSEVLDLLKAGNGKILLNDGKSGVGIRLLCETPAGGTLVWASQFQKDFFGVFGGFGGGINEWTINANYGIKNEYKDNNRPTFLSWDFFWKK